MSFSPLWLKRINTRHLPSVRGESFILIISLRSGSHHKFSRKKYYFPHNLWLSSPRSTDLERLKPMTAMHPAGLRHTASLPFDLCRWTAISIPDQNARSLLPILSVEMTPPISLNEQTLSWETNTSELPLIGQR